MPRTGRPKGVLSPFRTVNCVRCGVAFETRHSGGRYCSAECRHRAALDAQQAYSHSGQRKQKYPERIAARNEVHKALLSGRLTKKPCEECGVLDVEAHHDDYSKPLGVRWLCTRHHRKADAEMREEALQGTV